MNHHLQNPMAHLILNEPILGTPGFKTSHNSVSMIMQLPLDSVKSVIRLPFNSFFPQVSPCPCNPHHPCGKATLYSSDTIDKHMPSHETHSLSKHLISPVVTNQQSASRNKT